MKKIVAMVLCVGCLLGVLAGCGSQETSQEEPLDVVGTWELETVMLDDNTYVDSDSLSEYDYSFTLNEDGSAEARVLGVTYITTYSVKDNRITFSDNALNSVKLEVVDDTLTMKISLTGAGLVFTRK